jgi:hypothetical protein
VALCRRLSHDDVRRRMRQWIIVNPWARVPSVIHALESVGETTTTGVVVF